MLYFSEINHRGNHAGTKARNDVETILRQCGAKPLNSQRLELQAENGVIRSNIANRLGFLRYYLDILRIRKETIIIQYPMLAFDVQFDYVQRLAMRNRVIFLVHDIQSLRRDGNAGLDREIEMLNLASGLIVHNRFMEQKLRELGIRVEKVYLLNCFDYLYEGDTTADSTIEGVAFAGNLEKSEFLPAMCTKNPHLDFHFYGNGWSENISHGIYHGSFPPDDIPGRMCGKYGLIWDGRTTIGCTGSVGEYMRINNPHKLSLYIAAGLPVVTWSGAAIAEFIAQHNLGITVEQLDDLQQTLSNIDDSQYENMKNNVLRIREDLIKGAFLRTALSAVEEDAR